MSIIEQRKRIIQRFGEKLHALRVAHGMTLTELAQALGYRAHGYISELEAGKKLPTAEFIVSAARFFNVSTDCLLLDDLDLPATSSENT